MSTVKKISLTVILAVVVLTLIFGVNGPINTYLFVPPHGATGVVVVEAQDPHQASQEGVLSGTPEGSTTGGGGNEDSAKSGASPLETAASDTRLSSSGVLVQSAFQAKAEWFSWSGGGVRGKTQAEENVRVNEHFAVFHKALLAKMHNADPTAKIIPLSDMLIPFVTEFVYNISDRPETHNADCAYYLLPHHQFACNALGSVSLMSKAARSSLPPPHHQLLQLDVMRNSLCSLQMACASWYSGRFNVTLTPELLSRIYNTAALPAMLRNQKRSEAFLTNFIHGGRNHQEYPFLAARAYAQVTDNRKRQALSLRPQAIRHTLRRTSATDVRPIFQGGEVGFDPQNITGFARKNGKPRRDVVELLTSSETLSVLFHRATQAAAVAASSGEWSGPAAEPCSRMDVIIFSGDSLTREAFFRLIHHIRYGLHRPVVDSTSSSHRQNLGFSWMPFFEIPIQEDFVYEVHSTYDRIRMFPSLSHDNHAIHTLNAYFVDLSRALKRQCKKSKDEPPPSSTPQQDKALLYLVFLWDPFTQRPRRDALGSCSSDLELDKVPKTNSMHYLFYRKHKKLNVTPTLPVAPLRSLGAVISAHVHGAVHWERVLFPALSSHWTNMLRGCDQIVCPVGVDCGHWPGATTGKGESDKEMLREPGAGPWTRFYVMTGAAGDPLGHNDIPSHYGPKLVSPLDAFNLSTAKVLTSSFKDERLARTLALFDWLSSTSSPQQQQNSGDRKRSLSKRYFSTIRILDKGKLPFAPGNVFAREDGTHLSCHGFSRLFGNGLLKSYGGSFLATMLFGNHASSTGLEGSLVSGKTLLSLLGKVFHRGHEELQSIARLGSVNPEGKLDRGRADPFAFLPIGNGTQGFLRPEYRTTDQCGDFGNLLLLMAFLHDGVERL